MPRYDYECKDCDTVERDVLRTIAQRGDPLPCSKCGKDISKNQLIGLSTAETWPPASYVEGLRMLGIDVNKMIQEHGGIVDSNVSGDNTTVIRSLAHYKQLLSERGLRGDLDPSDGARDLHRDWKRQRSYFIM